jgi:hypothetical protein
MMNCCDVLRVLWGMHRKEGRNVRELKLYTTDDLRRLHHASNDDPIRLIDGIVSRVQLVAVIRWRIAWERFGYALLLFVSVIAAIAAVIAATEATPALSAEPLRYTAVPSSDPKSIWLLDTTSGSLSRCEAQDLKVVPVCSPWVAAPSTGAVYRYDTKTKKLIPMNESAQQ